MTAQDLQEFKDYLRACTDKQVEGVYNRESDAGRDDYALLAEFEAESRGIFLP